MKNFEQAVKHIAKMSAEEAIRLADYVAAFVQKQAMEIKVQRRADAMLNAPCVHCGFAALVRNGRTGAGVPRFYCRNCKATSSATTNTVVAKFASVRIS